MCGIALLGKVSINARSFLPQQRYSRRQVRSDKTVSHLAMR